MNQSRFFTLFNATLFFSGLSVPPFVLEILQKGLFAGLFFGIAFLYSMVGHGGASAYLLIMGFTTTSPQALASTALILNILAASLSWRNYHQAGHFSLRKTLPFILPSIPASYLGASLQISSQQYFLLLGLVLGITSLYFMAAPFFEKSPILAKGPLLRKQPILLYTLFTGGGIGFLSGILGIGGGVLLTPVAILLRLASPKVVAATSASFIVLNSVSGLIARTAQDTFSFPPDNAFLIPCVLLGSYAGSHLGAHTLPTIRLKQVLGLVMLIASWGLITK